MAERFLVTATALGVHLGMSRQRISALEKEGVFKTVDGGLFDQDECRLAYISWMRDARRETPKSEADTRAREARARQIEIRVAREEGRLVEIGDVEDGIAAIVSTFRSELGGVSAAASRDLVVRRAVDGAINDAVGRLRERFAALGSRLRAGVGGDVDDPAPASGRVGRRK